MAMPADAVIPQDLVMEILSRVPVKSLMRFKCVSKTWNSLIFHPTFIKLHLQRSPKNTHILLICQEDMVCKEESAATCSVSCLLEDPSSTIEEGCYDFDSNYFLLGSCNGLVCLLGSFVGNGFMEYWVRFWNPTTRIMSEDSPHLRLHSCQYKLGNVLVKFGFGYDDWSDTYKVVVVVFDIKSHNWEVRVYCLGDTSWRSVLNCPAFPISEQIDGHFVSGTVNWLALRECDVDFQWKNVSLNQLVIFSYDLNKETYKYLLMPDGLTELPDAPHLWVLKGCLCLSLDLLTQGYIITHFVIWQMKEFGDEKSWTQLLKVSYEHLQTHDIHRYTAAVVRPLCMSENDDIVLLANYHCSEFVFYNQKHNKIDRSKGFHGKFPTCSYGYVQSLVLPYLN